MVGSAVDPEIAVTDSPQSEATAVPATPPGLVHARPIPASSLWRLGPVPICVPNRVTRWRFPQAGPVSIRAAFVDAAAGHLPALPIVKRSWQSQLGVVLTSQNEVYKRLLSNRSHLWIILLSISVPSTTAATAVTTVAPTTAATTVVSTTALPTTTTTTAAPPAWAAVAPGKFSVGVATLVIDDPAGVRPLSVDVWFPLSDKADKATLSPEQYTLLPGVYYQSPTALAAKVDQISSETFPLVVYSHGSGGLR